LRLERLVVRQFRNLPEVELGLGAGVNWIVGENGAGKTALLEAVYCLSRGRTFRGRRHGPLVMRGRSRADIVGWQGSAFGPQRIEWSSEGAGSAGRTSGSAGRDLRIRLICDATPALVEGDPGLRRRFIDWNVSLWDRRALERSAGYRRLAAQRNAWLRSGAPDPGVWDAPYADALAAVMDARERFFEAMARAFRAVTREAGWFDDLELEWQGIDLNRDRLLTRLGEMRGSDRERGFTFLGASRCDFCLRQGASRWAGSRGQAKAVGCLMQLAAERVVGDVCGAGPVWLVDDLDAELSPAWAERVLELLRSDESQILVTALPGKAGPGRGTLAEDMVFHVEHGQVSSAGAEKPRSR
jgi:DNA replication and repair protein RecF